jgi:hypothetical protein
MTTTEKLPYSTDVLELAVTAAMSFADVEWDTMIFDWQLAPTRSRFDLVEPGDEGGDEVVTL